MMLPILIDCDEVLSDFAGALLELARRQAGIYADRSELTSWKFSEALGWPGAESAVTEAIRHREFCYRLDELPGAIAWLRAVEDEFGADRVFICTSPWNGAWADQRMCWLEKRGVPSKRIIQTCAKHLIPGYLIDDAIHHIEARPDRRGFLVAQPWNKDGAGKYPRGDLYAATGWLRAVVE